MIAVVSPEEMREIDKASVEAEEVLVARAGAAVARVALAMLGGAYGRRVVVVTGKGNNGADGRVAAARLRRAGARVRIVEAAGPRGRLPVVDLVIDAAYGTGLRAGSAYEAPDPGGVPVLAVDIPSGVDGLTGEAGAGAVRADRTVTFAALKPGLLLSPGIGHAGATTVAGIGLDVGDASMALVEEADCSAWIPLRPRESHKWRSAVWVAAGSPGMVGAAQMAARAAMRAGAGTVRLGVPGIHVEPTFAEVVGSPLPAEGWAQAVLGDLERTRALVVGPGLGRSAATSAEVRRLLSEAPVPAVVDADALWALGSLGDAAPVLGARRADTVLTPHEGEFRRLTGAVVPADRVAAVRQVASATGATVLLKGSTTVVAGPDGRVLFCTAGDQRLATAGSGDVLAGVVGALLAQGLDGFRAAAAAAFVHGAAGHLGWRRGLVAGDLPDLLPAVLDRLGDPGRTEDSLAARTLAPSVRRRTAGPTGGVPGPSGAATAPPGP